MACNALYLNRARNEKYKEKAQIQFFILIFFMSALRLDRLATLSDAPLAPTPETADKVVHSVHAHRLPLCLDKAPKLFRIGWPCESTRFCMMAHIFSMGDRSGDRAGQQ